MIRHLNNDQASDAYEAAIGVSYALDSLVAGNVIDGVNKGMVGGGIFISRSVEGIVVKENRIRGVRSGIMTDGNSNSTNRVIVQNNVVTAERTGLLFSLQAGGGKQFQIVGNLLKAPATGSCITIGSGALVAPLVAHNVCEGGAESVILAGEYASVIGNSVTNAAQRAYRIRDKVTFIGNVALDSGTSDYQIPSNEPLPTMIGNLMSNSATTAAPVIAYAATVPASGQWRLGDLVYSTAPVPGGDIGWVCTQGGSPGTWKSFGAIQA